MAWPKKGTRKLVVGGVAYLWHAAGHFPFCSDAFYTVGQSGQPHVLYIDPHPHDFEVTPKSVAGAVEWAVGQGWTPAVGPTRAMAFDSQAQSFVWLPEGSRHLTNETDAVKEMIP